MGKRKSRRKPPTRSTTPKLDNEFNCPFCSNLKCINVKLNHSIKAGTLRCRLCNAHYTSKISSVAIAVDLYSEWIDACVEANDSSADVETPPLTSGRHTPTSAQSPQFSPLASAVSATRTNSGRPIARTADAADESDDDDDDDDDDWLGMGNVQEEEDDGTVPYRPGDDDYDDEPPTTERKEDTEDDEPLTPEQEEDETETGRTLKRLRTTAAVGGD